MSSPMKIKLLSWNIWFNCYFSEITKFINEADADIVALQEVVLNDPTRDIVTFMEHLGYKYAIVQTSPEFVDDKGVLRKLHTAIFSRFPIIESKIHPLREGKKPSAAEVTVRIGDQFLKVFSVHLKHDHLRPSEVQNTQADTVAKILPKERSVLMGDFNALADSYAVKLIGGIYRNTNSDYRPTWSVYPEGCSVCKPQNVDKCLDYIFVSPDITSDSFEVGISKGSDHLPISVSINV